MIDKLRSLPVSTIATLVVAVLGLGFLTTLGGDVDTKTVSARFPRAVSVFEGTEVRILGVNVGRVTAVIPDGDAVRVEMEYEETFQIPATAQAAIVTPTLVSDRFVQLTPAFSGGPVMEDGAEIDMVNTGVPVELDRIYAALKDLTVALGPNGVNENGTLNNTLRAAEKALKGNGKRGNQMLRDLSDAAVTFGQGSGDLFATVEELAGFTQTLAENDAIVRAFTADLASVSEQLAGEREELAALLAALSDSVGTVETFVRNNRKALVKDVEQLTRIVKNINSERENLDLALATAPVAIGNLTLAYNVESGSIGSRIGLQGNIADLDGFLCAIVQQTELPTVSKDLACEIFSQIVENANDGQPSAGRTESIPFSERKPTLADVNPGAVNVQELFASAEKGDLRTLLGGVAE